MKYLYGILVAIVVSLMASAVAVAQTPSATLTAVPVAPSVWRISGSGFSPNERLRVVEIPCGSLPCGADTTAAAAVTVGADGTFTADIDFSHENPPPGRDFFVVAAFPTTRAGLASDPTVSVAVAGGVTIDKQLYVIGDDSSIVFDGEIPRCAEATLTTSLYQKGPASQSNVVDPTVPSGTAKVDGGGVLHGTIPLPSTLALGPVTAWAAVSGACLVQPLFASNFGVLIGIRDIVENPNGSGTIFIPTAVLSSTGSIPGGVTLGAAMGSLTVLADGKVCVAASLTSTAVLDSKGNARIHFGGPGQPSECSRAGAILTFIRGDNGLTLVEKRRMNPGVTQPLANMAPEAAGTGSVVPPVAPGTGTGAFEKQDALPSVEYFVLIGLVTTIALGLVAVKLHGTRVQRH